MGSTDGQLLNFLTVKAPIAFGRRCGHRVRRWGRIDGLRTIEVGTGGRRVNAEVIVGKSEFVAEERTTFDKYVGYVGDVWVFLAVWCAMALLERWARLKQIKMNDEQPRTIKEIRESWKSSEAIPALKCTACGYEMLPKFPKPVDELPNSFRCPICGTGKDAIQETSFFRDERIGSGEPFGDRQ
ncbi:hypothetical protein NDN08_007785 [Rhodosorus marinus]|uniref:Rubredoxin-like domain-containing protein n=1 Tax=Rhodosorus marinus TaxID=101924 RepID=A0AAV8V1C5_9RHOD|nr:hypothetical protein NDN08_007785 [Rhodosorus marinus]